MKITFKKNYFNLGLFTSAMVNLQGITYGYYINIFYFRIAFLYNN